MDYSNYSNADGAYALYLILADKMSTDGDTPSIKAVTKLLQEENDTYSFGLSDDELDTLSEDYMSELSNTEEVTNTNGTGMFSGMSTIRNFDNNDVASKAYEDIYGGETLDAEEQIKYLNEIGINPSADGYTQSSTVDEEGNEPYFFYKTNTDGSTEYLKVLKGSDGEAQLVQTVIPEGSNTGTTNVYDHTYLKGMTGEISINKAEIQAAEALSSTENVSEATSSTSTLGLEDLKALVSEDEWALVEENNIELTEKLDDGSARYIFAKGQKDGQYHIYDMSATGYYSSSGGKIYGTSLVRLIYGACGGGGIVKVGNGYIIDEFQVLDDECSDNIVYSLNCDGSVDEECCCYSTASPLSFDLDGDGVNLSDEIINYDIDGDGKTDTINDSADAVLVFDKDGDGVSGTDGSECFGNNTDLDGDGVKDGYNDGFEALKTFAYEEGLINGGDDMTLDENDIKLLEEEYGFKIKTNGYNSEASSLLDAGITEINLADTNDTTTIDNIDGNGNQIMYQNGATFKIDGETREYADIWHKKQDE